jgi:hypothetical protein
MSTSSYPEELARLIAVLDRAVEEQPDADRIVRVCAATSDVPVGLARKATRGSWRSRWGSPSSTRTAYGRWG